MKFPNFRSVSTTEVAEAILGELTSFRIMKWVIMLVNSQVKDVTGRAKYYVEVLVIYPAGG